MTTINAPTIQCVADEIGSQIYVIEVAGITYHVRAHSPASAEETARAAWEGIVERSPAGDAGQGRLFSS